LSLVRLVFSLHGSRHPRARPSFPTRRSSDLVAAQAAVRAGRLNRFVLVRRLREAAVAAVARKYRSVRARTTYGFEMDLPARDSRSEEHTSELQSLAYLVCRLLLEKKKKNKKN